MGIENSPRAKNNVFHLKSGFKYFSYKPARKMKISSEYCTYFQIWTMPQVIKQNAKQVIYHIPPPPSNLFMHTLSHMQTRNPLKHHVYSPEAWLSQIHNCSSLQDLTKHGLAFWKAQNMIDWWHCSFIKFYSDLDWLKSLKAIPFLWFMSK